MVREALRLRTIGRCGGLVAGDEDESAQEERRELLCAGEHGNPVRG